MNIKLLHNETIIMKGTLFNYKYMCYDNGDVAVDGYNGEGVEDVAWNPTLGAVEVVVCDADAAYGGCCCDLL